MAEVLIVLTRIERVDDGRYQLEITIGTEPRRIACTVVEGGVTAVQYDPDPFPRLAADPRPLTQAVLAFHKAAGGGTAVKR